MVTQSLHHALDRDAILRALSSFYGITTADGNPGGTTLFCSALIASNDFISDKTILLQSGLSIFEDSGATGFNNVNGQITVTPAFSSQVLAGTGFYVLNASSAAAAIALINLILARIGDPSAHILTSLTAKWGDIARSLDLILGARWDAGGDIGTDIAAIITATNKLAGAELDAVHAHADDLLWQPVFEMNPLTTRRKIRSIWLDFVNLTQSMNYRLRYQVDAVNYRTFDSNVAAPWTIAMDDGVLIECNFVVAHPLILELQSVIAEGAARNIPYNVYYEEME
ncbi:MAG: hypothetical protein Q8N51_06430 [Gammaproteobacteria bacterium]|nr:hypothetical protein [Gammaproteobacteria bacterium]